MIRCPRFKIGITIEYCKGCFYGNKRTGECEYRILYNPMNSKNATTFKERRKNEEDSSL